MLSIIGIIFIIIGAIIGAVFNGFEVAVMCSFASVMFGAGLACAGLWEKRKPETKNWVTILCIALLGLGSFVLGFAGQVAEDKVIMIITYVVAIAMIITGLLVPLIQNKLIENKAAKKKK